MANNEELVKILSQIQRDVSGLNAKIDDVRKDLNAKINESNNKLYQKIDDVRQDLKEDIGRVYESGVRQSIAKKYGFKYSEPFSLQDGYGLARLAAPKKKTLLSDEAECNDVLTLQLLRANKIAQKVIDDNLVDHLRGKITSFKNELKKKSGHERVSSFKKLTSRAEKWLQNWDTINTQTHDGSGKLHKLKELLLTTDFIIMCITAEYIDIRDAVKNNEPPFFSKLDIDIRGEVSSMEESNAVYIFSEVGEVKSSTSEEGIKKGTSQLKLTLLSIQYASKAIYGETTHCVLKGRLFLPSKFDQELEKGNTQTGVPNIFIEIDFIE